MIVLTGHIYTDPETLPKLFARLEALCESSRQEDGCHFYHMAVEDAAKGKIMIMEGWRDRETLDAHLQLPEIQQLFQDFDGKSEADVLIHEVASSKKFGV